MLQFVVFLYVVLSNVRELVTLSFGEKSPEL